MKFSDLEPQAQQILQLYEQPKAAMLPLLWLVQENQGFVSQEAEAWVGRILGVARSHVREAVSFYNMFHTKPVGRREPGRSGCAGQRFTFDVQSKLRPAQPDLRHSKNIAFPGLFRRRVFVILIQKICKR